MQDRNDYAIKVTWIGFFVNLILTALKLFAGIAGRSNAMIADAIHSLSDFATDIVVLLGFNFVKKPADKDHKYGHAKYETMSATIIGLLLFLVGIWILYSGGASVIRTLKGEVHAKPDIIAFFAAILSIVSKEALYQYTVHAGKKINSQAVIANAWHHRSDALSSIGTMIGIGLAIFLGDKWVILDPIAAIVVSFFIIKVAIDITRTSVGDLLEQSLSEDTENEILSFIKNIKGVKNPHNIMTRRIGNSYAIDIHIEVSKNLTIKEAHDISTIVEENVKGRFGEDTFISVHVEPEDETYNSAGGL